MNALSRISLYSLIVLSATLWGTGCSGEDSGAGISADGKKQITLLTMQLKGTHDEMITGIISAYEAQNPGTSVEWVDFPFQNYENKLLTSLIGPNPPDVINIGSEPLRTYVDSGHFEPLDSHLGDEVLGSYVPTILEDACKIGENYWALPWYGSTEVATMNTEIVKEAGLDPDAVPKYYSELPEFCKTVLDKTGKFGFFPIYTENGRLRVMLAEAGVPLLTEDGKKAAFNTPRGVEVFKFWSDLYRNKLVPDESLTEIHRRPLEYYKTERLALHNMAPVFIGGVQKDAPTVYEKTKVGTKLIWEDEPRYFMSLHVLGVAKKSKHPKEAAKFAAFVTNAQNQLTFAQRTVIIPSVTEALQDPYFAEPGEEPMDQTRRMMAEAAMNGRVLPALPHGKKLLDVFEEVTEAVCLGNMEAAEGLAIAEEKWNAILAD